MEYQKPVIMSAIERAEPKSKLIERLFKFGAHYEEGEALKLSGEVHRNIVRHAVDPEAAAGPVAGNWAKTNEWILAFQEELAKAIHDITMRRIRELEKGILEEFAKAENEPPPGCPF